MPLTVVPLPPAALLFTQNPSSTSAPQRQQGCCWKSHSFTCGLCSTITAKATTSPGNKLGQLSTTLLPWLCYGQQRRHPARTSLSLRGKEVIYKVTFLPTSLCHFSKEPCEINLNDNHKRVSMSILTSALPSFSRGKTHC